MKRLTQLSILLLGLCFAMPLYAEWNTDIKELEKALESFINNRNVSLSNPYLIEQGQPIDKKSINVKETDWVTNFTCTDDEPLTSLWKELMAHIKNASFFHCSSEMPQKSEPWKGLRLDGRDGIIVLSGRDKNVYVLTFKDKDGNDNGFFLSWNDLPDGGKKGTLDRFIGRNPELVTLAMEESRVTMDSVRTAIKIGETVKNSQKGTAADIDTTYIDGKWAVSTEYHLKVLREMDHVSDHYDDFPGLNNKVNKLAELSRKATSEQLASIGFALKREASRYERLLTPEEFSLIWKGLFAMQTKAKKADAEIQIYFRAAEIILRGKVNESIYLGFTDTRRHKFLQETGFTITKHKNGRPYFAVWGKHYTGNPDLIYLDACADEDGVLQYHAQHVETNLMPGVYRLTAAGRTSYSGNTGAFIFAQTDGKPMLEEIPACDDRGGSIWREAALRVKEADDKGTQISPNDVRIAMANGGMGYGWNKIVIDNIIVRDGKLTYGVSCDEDFTGRPFTGHWLSAVDFVLERTGELP